jgi:peptidoglycan hydrolase CwlO-like protein
VQLIRTIRAPLVFLLAAALLWSTLTSAFAAEKNTTDELRDMLSLEETRELLQKGLSIHEIDQEIARLTAEEPRIAARIEEARLEAEKKGLQLKATKERAGRVVRAYYMGQRQPIWLLVLSAKSLTQALTIYEFITHVLESDQRALKTFQQTQAEWKQSEAKWLEAQTELRSLKSQLVAEREKLIGLQQELDAKLATLSNAEEVKETIFALTTNWEQHGLPLFQSYFTALSEAINQLPELLTQSKNLVAQGFNYTFRMGDSELNDFLRGKNELFHHFTFEFHDGYIVVYGNDGDVEVSIRGRYVLENQPNAIRFHIDELMYNGLQLPESTAQGLERDYELAIYPQNFAAFFVATGVLVEKGTMSVTLTMDFLHKLR